MTDHPVFTEPWEAQAFAMATTLVDRGVFTAEEWAETLGAEIKRAQAAGDPDDGSTYYTHWMRALERLAREKGLADDAAVTRRAEEWRRAYLAMPHGQPVELKTP
ncbi:MAG: nitrile hydratase accessory protein [Rhodospirillaceae bacterium]